MKKTFQSLQTTLSFRPFTRPIRNRVRESYEGDGDQSATVLRDTSGFFGNPTFHWARGFSRCTATSLSVSWRWDIPFMPRYQGMKILREWLGGAQTEPYNVALMHVFLYAWLRVDEGAWRICERPAASWCTKRVSSRPCFINLDSFPDHSWLSGTGRIGTRSGNFLANGFRWTFR